MFTEWVIRLKEEFTKPLPGIEVQIRLSPPGRIYVRPDIPAKESAVLIVLYPAGDAINTIFIKRTEYDGAHSGQVSFPGGMYENEDINLTNTALRETCEETGICFDSLKIIGALTSLYIPISRITVYPFVAYCSEKPHFTPDPAEVKYIIETSLNNLLDPCNHKTKNMRIGESEILIPYFDIYGDHIWGATAMILAEFLEILKRAGHSE